MRSDEDVLVGVQLNPVATAQAHAQENRVITVLSDLANEEIAVRQTFGWQFLASSARSFATGGNFIGAGTNVGGLGVGAGHIQLANAHFTDLTFVRTLDPRLQGLRNLESRFDSIGYDGPASRIPPAVAGAVAGPGMIGLYVNFFPFTTEVMVGGLVIGGLVYLIWNGVRQSAVGRWNEEIRQQKLQILAEAKQRRQT